ncbi:MAG: Panacea domain-containing protein [Leptospirales bacterium]|nr:Panacea domain-containing protein [Leptospirales bacterium]
MEFIIPYREKRIEGAIAFFASKHKEKAKKNLSQTALYKYLAFFDFNSLEDSGEPALGLTYIAMERGPVPSEIYKEKNYRKSNYYKFLENKETKAIEIIPTSSNSDYLEYFSKYDKKLMNNLIKIFAKRWVTTSDMSDASHEKIKAWKKTWKNKKNSVINMADTFDNLEEKYINHTATMAEEHFYISQKLHGN